MNIDKGVPAPEKTPHSKNNPKYPFAQMEPGDSIFVEGQNAKGAAAIRAYSRQRIYGEKYTIKSYDDGVRIWRIS